jgi:hypothetical protein
MSNVKFRVDRSRLVSALRTIAAAAPSGKGKRIKPVLQAARITIDDRGLIATATDLDVAAACRIEIAETSGAIQPAERLIDLALLSRLAKETAKTPTIAIEFPAAGGLRLDALGTLPDVGGEFPEFAAELDGSAGFEPIAAWIGNAAELDQAIAAVEFATDPNSSRYALGSLCLEFIGGTVAAELAAVATDGRRLAVARIAAGIQPGEIAGSGRLDPALRYTEPAAAFLLPAKAAAAFSAAIPAGNRRDLVAVLELLQRPAAVQPEPQAANQASEPDRRLRLTIADNRGNVRAVLVSRETAGRFPKWREVCRPGEFKATGTIAADGATIAAFKQAIAILPADNRGSRFAIRGNRGFLIGLSRINGRFCGRFSGTAQPDGSASRSTVIDPALLFPWLVETQPAAETAGGYRFSQAGKDQPIFLSAGGGFDFVLMPMAGAGRRRS